MGQSMVKVKTSYLLTDGALFGYRHGIWMFFSFWRHLVLSQFKVHSFASNCNVQSTTALVSCVLLGFGGFMIECKC